MGFWKNSYFAFVVGSVDAIVVAFATLDSWGQWPRSPPET